MTPMLQQAIGLLQLSRLELVQELRQQMEQNPVLEEVLEEVEEPQLPQEQETPEERGGRRGRGHETGPIGWRSSTGTTISRTPPTTVRRSLERNSSGSMRRCISRGRARSSTICSSSCTSAPRIRRRCGWGRW